MELFSFYAKEKLAVPNWMLSDFTFWLLDCKRIKKIGTELEIENPQEIFKAMRPFEIKFDFPVASSNLKISLNATAELHHSEPYFAVHNFYLADGTKNKGYRSVLPDQEIKRIKRNDGWVWVHKDSGKESELSLAIGKGIESIVSGDELDKL